MYSDIDEKIINLILFLACFCITISHLLTYSLSIFRWIGIGVITLVMLYETSRFGLKRNTMIRAYVVLFVMLLCTCMCETSLQQKALSAFYFAVLIIWMFYSENVIHKKENYLWMGFGTGFACILGLFLTRTQVVMQLSGVYSNRIRMYGGFSHPNILGAMLASAFLEIAIYLYLSPKGKIPLVKKFTLILYEIILAILVLFTNSRTALIMMIGAVLTLFSIYLNRLKLLYRAFFYMLIIAFGVYILDVYVMDYILNDAAYSARIEGITNIDYSILQSMVGHGMTNAEGTVSQGVHGIEIAWVSVFYKVGAIGLVMWTYMTLFMFVCILNLRNLRQKKAALACLVFTLLSTLGEAYIINIANSASFFMWAGTSALSSCYFQDEEISCD